MFARSVYFFGWIGREGVLYRFFFASFAFVSLAQILFILFASSCFQGRFRRSVFPGMCNKTMRGSVYFFT